MRAVDEACKNWFSHKQARCRNIYALPTQCSRSIGSGCHHEPEAQSANLHSAIDELFYQIHRMFERVGADLDS